MKMILIFAWLVFLTYGLLAESGDPFTQWAAAATAVAITVGFAFQIILQVMAKQAAAEAARKVEEVAKQAEIVKQTLVIAEAASTKKLNELANVARATHTLVNNNMAVQLAINKRVSWRLAELTKGTPTGQMNLEAAELAERLYNEHMSKQDKLDAESTRLGDFGSFS